MARGITVLGAFWALPAILRLALCEPVAFSVQNDLLAFPQYEIIYSSSFIPAHDAEALLTRSKHSSSPSADDSYDGQTPVSDSESIADVSVHQYAQDQTPKHGNSRPSDDASRDTHERLVLNNRPYLCTIPYVKPISPRSGNTNDSSSSEAAESERKMELARATEHGLEMLKDMQGNCIYYVAGWWVYSFCYNEAIKQFHPLPPGRHGAPPFPPTEDTSVHSYLLGRFPAQLRKQEQAQATPQGQSPSQQDTASDPASASSLQTAGSTAFLVQRLAGGTSCDLTGQDRRIEVQFHCNPSAPDHIQMIKETASCVYLMVIHTPRLCNNVAFLPAQTERPHGIACREIIGSADEEADWRVRKEAEARSTMRESKKVEDQEIQEHLKPPATPLVIGGITVGAQSLVGGTSDRTISASNIIGATSPQRQLQAHAPGTGLKPGAEGDKFLATLAKSDGQFTSSLSEAKIKELGLKGTRKELQRWIKEMEDNAGEGVPWRLDVWRITGGFEFRGIILTGGEEDGEGQGGTVTKGAGTVEKDRAKAKARQLRAVPQDVVPQGPQEDEALLAENNDEEAFYDDEAYGYGPEDDFAGEHEAGVYEDGEDGPDEDAVGSQEEFR